MTRRFLTWPQLLGRLFCVTRAPRSAPWSTCSRCPRLDIFDGIVVATRHGLRFIDADHVAEITRSRIRARLSDAEAGQLPPPDGPPVYRVDALEYSGHNLHDYLGRIFGRPHWKREHD